MVDFSLSFPEKMTDFFQRSCGYIPLKTKKLLDLGIGIGLELKSIFDGFSDVDVTCIDMNVFVGKTRCLDEIRCGMRKSEGCDIVCKGI